MAYLVSRNILQENIIIKNDIDELPLYSWRTRDRLSLIIVVKPHSYFVYKAALALNGVIKQSIPVYLNYEHAPDDRKRNYKRPALQQEDIHNAFAAMVRLPSDHFRYHTTKFVLLNGNYTGQLGVVLAKDDEVCFSYTDLQRTMLDCVVRPESDMKIMRLYMVFWTQAIRLLKRF